MAINKNSNIYTIIYTVVMVVIVASLLAFLATSLKDKQGANILNDQKFSIMKAFGAADENSDKGAVVEDFDANVAIGLVSPTEDGVSVEWLDPKSEDAATKERAEKKSVEVFELLGDRKTLAAQKSELPVFKYEKAAAEGAQAETLYVLPMTGTGLWGDIWGYVAVKANAEGQLVISGIVMSHAGETPGLGAEIANAKVQDKFAGKLLYDADGAFAVEMVKGMTKKQAQADASKVDAITGGTKTCDGVNEMLARSIGNYESFLKTYVVGAIEDTACEECTCCAECTKECAECTKECADCTKKCADCTKECETCDKAADCTKECAHKCEKAADCTKECEQCQGNGECAAKTGVESK